MRLIPKDPAIPVHLQFGQRKPTLPTERYLLHEPLFHFLMKCNLSFKKNTHILYLYIVMELLHCPFLIILKHMLILPHYSICSLRGQTTSIILYCVQQNVIFIDEDDGIDASGSQLAKDSII